MYAAVIYNYYNNVVRVEERPTRKRAIKAGEFFKKKIPGGWYLIVEGQDIDLYQQYV